MKGARKDSQPRRPRTESLSVEFSSPPLEGWLLKKGAKGIRGWKRRWFTLNNDRLMYYKNSSGTPGSEQGFIDLSGDYEIEYEGEGNSRNFRIKTANRIWYLLAEAEEERRFWVEGLNYFKKRQQREKQNLNNPFSQSVNSKTGSELLGFESSQNYTDEELLELQQLLLDAEKEIDSKQSHINELNSDLQNSIQIIKAKGEQVELLQDKLNSKEKQNKELLQGNIQLREEISKLRKIISNLSNKPLPADGSIDPSLFSPSIKEEINNNNIVNSSISGDDNKNDLSNDNHDKKDDIKEEKQINDSNNSENNNNNNNNEENNSDKMKDESGSKEAQKEESVNKKIDEISKKIFNFDSAECIPEIQLLEGELSELKSLFSYKRISSIKFH